MPQNDFASLLGRIRDASLPISSIDEDATRDLIMSADVIWGYDPKRDLMPLFYGKELLADIAKGREAEFGYQMLLCFTIDLSTQDDAKSLYAAVKQLKGSCCYQRPSDRDSGIGTDF